MRKHRLFSLIVLSITILLSSCKKDSDMIFKIDADSSYEVQKIILIQTFNHGVFDYNKIKLTSTADDSGKEYLNYDFKGFINIDSEKRRGNTITYTLNSYEINKYDEKGRIKRTFLDSQENPLTPIGTVTLSSIEETKCDLEIIIDNLRVWDYQTNETRLGKQRIIVNNTYIESIHYVN